MSYTLSRYKTPSWSDTMKALRRCFEMWDVQDWSAEPNVPLAAINRAKFTLEEAAVTLRYMKDGREVVMSMDTQEWPGGNLRALFLCVDAMRLLDVRGFGKTVATAYMQLSAPVRVDPWIVLGLRPDASPDQINAMYLYLAKQRHPDNGGSTEAMAELNAARAAALGEAVPA